MLFLIVNLQTLLIFILAVASTYLWIDLLYFNCITYKRREVVFIEYTTIKGYLRAIYFVSLDWIPNGMSNQKLFFAIFKIQQKI